MTKPFVFYCLSCVILLACRQSPAARQEQAAASIYSNKKDSLPVDKLFTDTSKIVILPVNGIVFFSLKDSIPAKLTNQDLPIIDQLLATCIKDHNTGADSANLYSGYIDLKKYKRQYVPFLNAKGEKNIFINCFCTGVENFDYWKKRLVEVDDGGICFFNITINLTKHACGPLLINGPG